MTHRFFIAEANDIVKSKLNNITKLSYAEATMDPEDPHGLFINIDDGDQYIAVGYGDNIRWFGDWNTACDYANTLTTKNYIGIKEPTCDLVRFTPIALINGK